jgi:hypothetical protein
VGWATAYLNNIKHQPDLVISQAAAAAAAFFDNAKAGDEAEVLSLFNIVKHYSIMFVRGADQLPARMIEYEQCRPAQHIRAAFRWWWTRNDESRVIVQYEGAAVFEAFSGRIRGRATANSGQGSPLALDSGGHPTTGAEPAFVLCPPHSSTR